ncbi:ATP-binding cassette-type vacuolar membrane transporter Hmt1 [Dispira simplex]|nr:ATP-binding cassette-type vacuolar membrane transporter Hmt1 [Dispira simplex]
MPTTSYRDYVTATKEVLVGDKSRLLAYSLTSLVVAYAATLEPVIYHARLHPNLVAASPVLLFTAFVLYCNAQPIPSGLLNPCDVSVYIRQYANAGKNKKGHLLFGLKVYLIQQVFHYTLLSVYAITVVCYAVFYSDPLTPADWHPWLIKGIICQSVMVGLLFYYIWLHQLALLNSLITPFCRSRWPMWMAPWLVLFSSQLVELYHIAHYMIWPQCPLETSGYFRHWLVPTISACKIFFVIISLVTLFVYLRMNQKGWFDPVTASSQQAEEKAESKNSDEDSDDEDESECVTSGPYMGIHKCSVKEYNLFTRIVRVGKIVWSMFYPLDWQVVRSLVLGSTYRYFAKWISALEPYYHKQFLDSLENEAVVYGLLLRLGIVRTFHAIQRSSFFTSYISSGTIRDYLEIKISDFIYGEFSKRSLSFFRGTHSARVHELSNSCSSAISEYFFDLVYSLGPEIFGIWTMGTNYAWNYPRYFFSLAAGKIFIKFVNHFAVSPLKWQLRYMLRSDNFDVSLNLSALHNPDTVKQFAGEKFHIHSYEEKLRESYNEGVENDVLLKNVKNYLFLMEHTLTLVGILMCLMYYHQGAMSGSDIMFFISHFYVVYSPLLGLLELGNRYWYTLKKCNILLCFLDDYTDVVDPPDALPWDILRGEIEFHDVTFGYKASKATLKNISFKVPAGTTTAIVGDSGGGKTTIFNLLMRFYDVNSGKITIDGKDIREVAQFDLRKDISLVPQHSIIFGHTMRFNIGYGAATRNSEATEDKIIHAATLANIHQRIMAMPQGYDTCATAQQMSKLSGGESQRVTIARGLLSNGKIVLLDEATSALDMITEREVQTALTKKLGSTTCLIIAHRLSTIIHADQILVLKNGEIAERGNFKQLKAKPDGLFREMWVTQMKDKGNQKVEDGNES